VSNASQVHVWGLTLVEVCLDCVLVINADHQETSMRTRTRFIIVVMSVGVGVLCASPRMFGQERITIQAVATLTWDEIVRIDAGRSLRPQTPRLIPPPHPGPGPREIGTLKHPETEVLLPELLKQGQTKSDATAFSLPPTLSFLAIKDSSADGFSYIPPDTHGAIGPSHAMTMLNSHVRIQNKTGTVTSTVSLASFWSAITGDKFDPKVLYDAGSSRWIAVCDGDGGLATSKVCFAMTTGSDPTGTWNFYEFDADAANTTWADYPGFGVNSTWVAITQNMFTFAGTFVGEKMWVIDKASALDGPPIATTVFATGFDVAGGFGGFTLQPCHTFGAEATLYIVDQRGLASGGTFLIRLSQITGTGPAPVWSVNPLSPFAGTGLFFVTNNYNYAQIDADQLGLATDIETNDPRMLNAVYRNGRIWCTHSAGLPVAPSSSNRTAVFWYQLNPTISSPIVQSGVLDGGAGMHYYFPGITANSANDAVVGFTRSDATMFAQGVYAGRMGTDALNTMKPIQTLKTGESSYTKFFSGSQNRWGDYSATVVDPSDDITFWTIQEYAGLKVGTGVNDGRWGTWWGKVDPATALPIQLSYFNGTVTAQGTVELRWGTLSETNNYGFEVEKSPNVPSSYQTIPNSFVPGHGTTIEPHHYSFTDITATSGTWWYRLKQIDLDGAINHTDGIQVDVLTEIAEQPIPTQTALFQSYPNPFNPSTMIRFELAQSSHTMLRVFDVLGREVATLVNEKKAAGQHAVEWLPTNLPSGVYYCRLEADGHVNTQKLVLLR
jgi:hypothetical protein